jgi:hypothetical protein
VLRETLMCLLSLDGLRLGIDKTTDAALGSAVTFVGMAS